jgi:hypothetical protein
MPGEYDIHSITVRERERERGGDDAERTVKKLQLTVSV